MYTWSMSSAEVQGLGHRSAGIPCQDKTCTLLHNRVRVIALADGAGSALLSHEGARVVVEGMARYAARQFARLVEAPAPVVRAMIAEEIDRLLSALADDLGCGDRDLASTLLLVAVKKKRYFALHIGDGVIGVYVRGRLSVLSVPANGECANQTWFTTSHDTERSIRLYQGDASSISGFILMSDGVEPSLYDMTTERLTDASINLMYCNAKYPEYQMRCMLEESIESSLIPRTRDDCSIALLSRGKYKHYKDYQVYLRMLAKRRRRSKVEGERNA